MEEKRDQGKIYEFTPRKGPKLKTAGYVAPEKKELLRKRKQAKTDQKNFYIGVGLLLAIVAVVTYIRLT